MSDFNQFVPEYIRRLAGYTPGKSVRQALEESRVNCIKLASNENPFGPSPRAVQAMQAVLADSNFYPDNDAIELRQKLADYHKVQPEQIVPTAGSDGAIGDRGANFAGAGSQRHLPASVPSSCIR